MKVCQIIGDMFLSKIVEQSYVKHVFYQGIVQDSPKKRRRKKKNLRNKCTCQQRNSGRKENNRFICTYDNA